jgi:hypothetical protein
VKKTQLSLAIFTLISFLTIGNSTLENAFATDGSSLNFYWYDNNSTELNRTFSEEELSQDQPAWWNLSVNTTDMSWNAKSLYLEKYSGGQWEEVMWGSLSEYSGPLPGLNAGYVVDALCGNRTWCSGKYKFRMRSSTEVLKEFTLTFIPKKSNLKIKLSSDREQAWGSIHTLRVNLTPKISTNCVVERNGENVGNIKVLKGTGSLGVTALAYKKPTSGRTTVTLYVVCKNTKYYGAQETNYTLFLP